MGPTSAGSLLPSPTAALLHRGIDQQDIHPHFGQSPFPGGIAERGSRRLLRLGQLRSASPSGRRCLPGPGRGRLPLSFWSARNPTSPSAQRRVAPAALRLMKDPPGDNPSDRGTELYFQHAETPRAFSDLEPARSIWPGPSSATENLRPCRPRSRWDSEGSAHPLRRIRFNNIEFLVSQIGFTREIRRERHKCRNINLDGRLNGELTTGRHAATVTERRTGIEAALQSYERTAPAGLGALVPLRLRAETGSAAGARRTMSCFEPP